MINEIFSKNYAGLKVSVWSMRITPAPEICIILYINKESHFQLIIICFIIHLNDSYFKIVMLALIVIKVFKS